jgi:hypothetical protein
MGLMSVSDWHFSLLFFFIEVWWFMTLIMFHLSGGIMAGFVHGIDVGAGTQVCVLGAHFRFPFWGTKVLRQSPSNFL